MIYSDGWMAYISIPYIAVAPPYRFAAVNHTLSFVDPGNPNIHTNNIETFWKAAKASFKRMIGTTKEMVPSHLDEFLYRDGLTKTIKYQRITAGSPAGTVPKYDILLCYLKHISDWYIP